MKKKQKITKPSSCLVDIKNNNYIFSDSLGKTKIHASQCDFFGNGFRTTFHQKNTIKTAFIDSYESHYKPSISFAKNLGCKKTFYKKNKEWLFPRILNQKDLTKKINFSGKNKNPFTMECPLEKKKRFRRHGSVRVLEAKMNGASYGYVLFLKLIGLGYKFSLYPSQKAKDMMILSIKVGHSHKFKFFIPKTVGIFLYPKNTLAIFSSEQEIIANLGYQIRQVRPPTRYKGKGIRFLNEVVLLKEGKKTK